ncbi:MAG: YdbH domain-containing protein [Novosphingobium sp.]|nr:YdbH domain-containing protein [Novosphingobium sp.]
MEPDYVLNVKGAHWPFLGGTLTLDPVKMTIGSEEVLRYTLRIKELDAGRFLKHIEMENLSATGQFEGTIPLVFDEDGGRMDGGSLVSLPPGGNVSYVGELTYEDLSPMGNFAFDALRSLDYKRMQIDMDGSLEGEIVTRVTFDGLGQGDLASRNFITKQVAKLPIRFKVNVRAPFLRLVTSVRSLYDADYLRNPETMGLVDLPVPPGRVVNPTTLADDSIQPPESEKVP